MFFKDNIGLVQWILHLSSISCHPQKGHIFKIDINWSKKNRLKTIPLHAQIQKAIQRGSNMDNVFLVDEGREDPNTTVSALLSARQ